jgi:hypothetical protein
VEDHKIETSVAPYAYRALTDWKAVIAFFLTR